MKKLAIITGSSKGIGLGIVQSFKNNNWLTLGISRSPAQLPILDYEILADLFQEEALLKLKDKIIQIKKEKNIEQICLIHNFGYTHSSSLLDTKEEIWDKTFNANVKIPFLLTCEISPLMPEGSSCIFIGSTLSTIAVPDSVAYIASKHAVAGLMKAVAIELKDKGIRSNLICPGFTDTDMADQVLEFSAKKNGLSLKEMKEKIASLSPLKRFLQPKEIGDCVLYFAENPSINGEILHVNGGFGL